MTLPTNPHEILISPKGRQYRLSGLGKVPNTGKWFGNTMKHHWCATIRYIDDGSFLDLYFDYENKLYKK